MVHLAGFVLAQLALAAWPAQEQKGPDQAGPQIDESRMISTSATVTAVDPKTRTITVTGPQGNTCSFKVSPAVKNFDKIKPNDQVVLDYFDSIAFQVVKPGIDADGQETIIEAAAPGEDAAVGMGEKTTMVATVEQINRTAPSITLKDSEGKLTTVQVRHPERLKLVKVGDTLKITYCQAVAVAVEPPQNSAH
jgi:hypothetical protein